MKSSKISYIIKFKAEVMTIYSQLLKTPSLKDPRLFVSDTTLSFSNILPQVL